MSPQPSSFRWRSIVEVAVISVVIYVFLGTSGFSTNNASLGEDQVNVPVAKAKVESLVYPRQDLQCPEHQYSIRIFSSAPLIVLIDDFLSASESQHLVDLSAGQWQVSTVFNQGVESIDDLVRKSEKAMIERDTIVQCIEQRALSFQGWPQDTFIERLWTQRYNVSGHYSHHYDWGSALKTTRRSSTFMVYLKTDELVGGGTNFPLLQRPTPAKDWCRFINCDDDAPGVTFKAREGAAVFWQNYDSNGRGWKETIHAGQPVLHGRKIALNIWSWYNAGHQISPEE